LKANQAVDKIIVPSEFSAEVFKKTVYKAQDELGKEVVLKLEKPIEVIGYPIKKFDSLPNLNLQFDYDFNFLCVAQAGPRKNLEKTVDYFYKTFKDKKVGLILKISKANNCLRDRLFCLDMLKTFQAQYPDSLCKIYLLHGFMTEEQIHALYVEPKIKCLLSLSHGEGFGLPIFEAAYSGMPVISHEWGGQTDFLFIEENNKKKHQFAKVDFELKNIQPEVVWDGVLEKDSVWAYPKESSVCSRMMEVYKDYGRFKGQAKKLKEYLLKNINNIEYKLAKYINDGDFQIVETKDLPKVSIITSVYNADQYIEQFLQDITRQTIFKEKCELILINANSPGNEEPIIKKYMEQYPNNIIYKRLDKDPGIYPVWNMGIKMASGEYITNANVDDRKRIDNLEVLARYLYSNKDVSVAYGQNFITNTPNETFENNSSNGNIFGLVAHQKQGTIFPKLDKNVLTYEGNLPHCMPMWRKDLHDKYGFFDETYKSSSDWEFWLRCLFSGEKIEDIKQIIGLYYLNPKGLSTCDQGETEWRNIETERVRRKYSFKLENNLG
jgi:glycosyltransferase involved in cell wall biosynthesis